MGLGREGRGPFCAGRSRPRATGPSPTPRFFPAAPRLGPAPLRLGLADPDGLLSASPCSPAAVGLVPWPPARRVGAARGGVGFGRWRLSPSVPGVKGFRVLSILPLALRSVSWDGGFRLHWSAAREELGLEEDGWQSSGPSEARGKEGVRGLRSSPFRACFLGEGSSLCFFKGQGIRYFNCLSRRGRGEKRKPPFLLYLR